MKNIFVFDAAESDILNIDEETVIRNTGVKSENVKEKVMNTIKSSSKTVRIIRKKTIFSVIAAAAALAVIGTVSVGAAGGFNHTFGEFFAGEPADGVYSGKDLSIDSSSLDIDFAGIAGDDTQVMAMMTIKNKDGSNFVKSAENTFITTFGIDADLWSNVNLEQSLWDSLFHNIPSYGGSIVYTMEDEGTINAMISYDSYGYGYLKGQRLTANGGVIYAYTPVKTVYTPKNGDGYSTYVNEGNESYWNIDYSAVEAMEKKYAGELKDGQVVTYSEKNDSIIIADKKEIKLDFKLGVTLNYKSTTRYIDSAKEKKYNHKGSEWTVDYINAKSFSIDFASHTYELKNSKEFDLGDAENWTEEQVKEFNDYQNSFLPAELKVKLSSGKVYTAVPTSSGSGVGENYGEVEVSYYYTDENGKAAALDPNEIVSVTFDGQELI